MAPYRTLKRLLLDRWRDSGHAPASGEPPARAQPRSLPDATLHHERGQALAREGRLEEALTSYARGIELAHDDVDLLTSQAVVLLELGRLEEAEDSFNLALAFDARSAGAWFGLGLTAFRRGAQEEARRCLLRAAELDPSLAAAHVQLGVLAYARERFEEAAEHFGRAAVLQPDLAELRSNLGLALQRIGRCEEAIGHLRQAVALRDDLAEAHLNLGNACHQAGRLDEAEASYGRACRVRPGYAEALNNLGNVHRDRGRLDSALECYEKAIAANADYAEAHYNAGVALHLQERGVEAIRAYERACAVRPGYPEARLNLALVQLTLGDLARGWEGYDSRFDQTNPQNHVNAARFPYPLWRGESLEGKRILVWGEQGIGDELLFASLYAEVVRAARECVIECSPKLSALFTRSFPEAAVVARGAAPHPATQGAFDFHAPAGSLARWLRPEVESFPDRRAYLVPDATRVAHWRRRLGALGPGLKVGFSWRSNNLKGDRALSCARIEEWEPILRTPGVRFVSLQYDECNEELARARSRFGVELNVLPEVDLFNDLDESVAVMQALDLVISAPTAVSVLAAAVGAETWQMDYGPAWHTLGTRRNPWFPAMRQYKRAWSQGWDGVMRRVAGDLQLAANAARAAPATETATAESTPASRPTVAEALAAGASHYQRGAFDAAYAAWREALDTDPASLAARANLGLVCYQQGRMEEAIACQREVIARNPRHADAHLNLALALLARGDFAEGWAEYEWRFEEGVLEERGRSFPFPRWQGEDLKGKTILVWKEQSIGSQLVYAGMLPDLAARGGFSIIECTPKLVPLFTRSFPDSDVVPRTEPPHPYTQQGIDFQIPIASLGAWLRAGLTAFPRHRGYLRADPEQVVRWKTRLGRLPAGPRVGFSWRSINTSGERALACTAIEQWAPILCTPGVQFVCLQYDKCSAELELARSRFGVALHQFEDLDLFNDLDGAAALTAALDLVISAPTAVTDLSAALGVPTWQLHHGTDWKMHGASFHPWFPELRRFQRGLYQPWPEVLDEIAVELRRWTAGRGG